MLGVVVVAAVVLAGAVAALWANHAWKREGARLVSRLEAQGTAANRSPQGSAADYDLPAPVARYFDLVLGGRSERIAGAQVGWTGEFQSKPGGGWRSFTARQYFTTDPPGFVWDARIRMLPAVSVHVRDSYVDGTATMQARIGGVIPVVNAGNTREIAASALVRWLGEAVWFPSALLPREDGSGVSWEAVDDSTARATVQDGAIRVSADFHFAPTGEIVRMVAYRYRDVNGVGVLTRFEGHYSDYRPMAGVLVPSAAEVAWILPDGRYPYWRGRPAEITYQFRASGS